MKTQLSIQEKLWELRKERNLNLEDVAKAVDISPATLSNYENKEYKDISLSLLTNLAKYYQVSLDWLAGLSESKETQNTAISELLLDDATLKLLKNGPFNHRLLCELIKHPHFMEFMLHTEIYVDGLATMQIKNINQIVDSVTMELVEQKNPNPNDLHLNTLEAAYIKEDEYFFHIIHNDLDTILRNIRENHQFDIDSACIEPLFSISEIKKRYAKIIRTIKNPTEAYWRVFCMEMGINYNTLSKEEHSIMKKVLKKAKKLQTFPNRKNKKRK